jgi:uncharacterized protein YbaP (TraB family)
MQIAMRLRKLSSIALIMLLTCGPATEHADEDTALFWSLARDGKPAGYLLGTIHSEDPRVLDFPETFIDQLTANDVFAMEMVPDLPTLTRLTEFMHYQDGTTLESRIGAGRFFHCPCEQRGRGSRSLGSRRSNSSCLFSRKCQSSSNWPCWIRRWMNMPGSKKFTP